METVVAAPPERVDPRFAATEFVIRASEMEWRAMREMSGTIEWESVGLELDARIPSRFPEIHTVLCCWWRIDGHLVMFYDIISVLTDWPAAKQWLDRHCPGRQIERPTTTPPTILSSTDELAPMFAETVFVVVANPIEHTLLERRVLSAASVYGIASWENDSTSYRVEIGHLEEHPMTVDLLWSTINGKRILFYSASSSVADHWAIEGWLDRTCNPRMGTQPARCNVENFHICAHYIAREPH